jgi:hypothetical protein
LKGKKQKVKKLCSSKEMQWGEKKKSHHMEMKTKKLACKNKVPKSIFAIG